MSTIPAVSFEAEKLKSLSLIWRRRKLRARLLREDNPMVWSGPVETMEMHRHSGVAAESDSEAGRHSKRSDPSLGSRPGRQDRGAAGMTGCVNSMRFGRFILHPGLIRNKINFPGLATIVRE